MIEGESIDVGTQLIIKCYPNQLSLPSGVLLYINGKGENNSTTITDSSPSPKVITRVGNTVIKSTQSKTGGGSIYFDGTGDYLSTPATGDLRFTTQSFTWEAWVYVISFASHGRAIISTARASEGGNYGHFLSVEYNGFWFRDWVTGNGAFFSLAVQLNTWYHVACAKVGSNALLWVDGIQATPGTFAVTNTPHTEFLIGDAYEDSGFAPGFWGYMEHIGVWSGQRYFEDFNPLTDTLCSYA